jgi:S-adenosylmethionine:tRNA ribosyltransferase-isomerase
VARASTRWLTRSVTFLFLRTFTGPIPQMIASAIRPCSPSTADRSRRPRRDRRLLDAIDAAGVERTSITLHVGYGTFKPVRVENVEDHQVDFERYEIGDQAAGRINRALDQKRRVVAIGTTTTRALEDRGRAGSGRISAGTGEARLFIYPGFEFRVISGLMTNFHLPRSSLLMLVSAFAGRERVLAAYQEAVEQRYRFYSYGDAMLII